VGFTRKTPSSTGSPLPIPKESENIFQFREFSEEHIPPLARSYKQSYNAWKLQTVYLGRRHCPSKLLAKSEVINGQCLSSRSF
jgi:hypothetical protein